jgi:hypothetical protein
MPLASAKTCVGLLLASSALVGLSAQGAVHRPDFSSQARFSAEWDVDGGEWQASNGLLLLTKAGVPSGRIRRPATVVVYRTPLFQRVTLDVELRSTAPVDVIYRDLQLIFGYESPTRFYYVHLSAITDDVHNGVFLVDNADRRRLDAGTTPPVLKDQDWHRVRLERDGATGRIQVFFDGSATPAWDLVDTTIKAGRVGLGSFDDTGEFRNVVVTER